MAIRQCTVIWQWQNKINFVLVLNHQTAEELLPSGWNSSNHPLHFLISWLNPNWINQEQNQWRALRITINYINNDNYRIAKRLADGLFCLCRSCRGVSIKYRPFYNWLKVPCRTFKLDTLGAISIVRVSFVFCPYNVCDTFAVSTY